LSGRVIPRVAAPIIFKSFLREIFIIKFRESAPHPLPLPSGEREGVRGLTGVARITIAAGPSLLMTIHTPGHVVSIDHFNRPLFVPRETVTNRAVDTFLNMNPVGKDDKLRELIHLLPWNLFSRLRIFNDFKRFRLLAHCVGGMASLAEFNVGETRGAMPFGISVAEIAVQIERLRMAYMVKKNGLIDRNPCKNRKDGEEGALGLNGKPVVGHKGKENNKDDADRNGESLFHEALFPGSAAVRSYRSSINYLYSMGYHPVKENRGERYLKAYRFLR
jgi:hypothetical protein